MPDVAFLLCAERPIELQAALLVQSIRDFGGSLAKAPIYSFQPRSGYEVSPSIRRLFDELEVEHSTRPLNRKYADYPPANKPIVCAYAEMNLPHDRFVLCDSDTLILNDIGGAVEKLLSCDIAIRPTHKKGIGYRDCSDANYDKYWHALWRELKLSGPRVTVETTIGGETIAGYWNSGFAIVKREAGIFSKWNELLELVRERPIEPAASVFYLDQIVLAAALHSLPVNIETLPLGYNYPIHRHVAEELPSGRRVDTIRSLKSIHYHGLIRDPYFINMLDSVDGGDEQRAWLLEQVKRFKIPPHYPGSVRNYRKLKRYIGRILKG